MNNYLAAMIFSVMLESRFRVSKLQVEKVIRTLKIKPGDKVADIGAGTGLFSRLLSKEVQPEGIVYAVDTNPILIKRIEKRSKKESTDNITILASDTNLNLPEDVDIMFMCNTLHYVENKTGLLKGAVEYLKSDGRFAVIDFCEKWPPFHKSMKIDMNEYEEWIRKSGLQLIEKHDFLLDSFNTFFHIYGKR